MKYMVCLGLLLSCFFASAEILAGECNLKVIEKKVEAIKKEMADGGFLMIKGSLAEHGDVFEYLFSAKNVFYLNVEEEREYAYEQDYVGYVQFDAETCDQRRFMHAEVHLNR